MYWVVQWTLHDDDYVTYDSRNCYTWEETFRLFSELVGDPTNDTAECTVTVRNADNDAYLGMVLTFHE